MDNAPRARGDAGLRESHISPCPQEASRLVRETAQPAMTAVQCSASSDRHRVVGEEKSSQMLDAGRAGHDDGGHPAAPREEGLCPLGLEKEEELCWHQRRGGGAFQAEPRGKGKGV